MKITNGKASRLLCLDNSSQVTQVRERSQSVLVGYAKSKIVNKLRTDRLVPDPASPASMEAEALFYKVYNPNRQSC